MVDIVSLCAVLCTTSFITRYTAETVALPSQKDWHLIERAELRHRASLWGQFFQISLGGEDEGSTSLGSQRTQP